MLAENFGNEEGFLVVFVGEIEDLPRGGGKIAGVLGKEAMWRGLTNTGSDGLGIVGFLFGDLVICDNLAGEGVPEEDFATISGGTEGLATGDEFDDFDHNGIITRNKIDREM